MNDSHDSLLPRTRKSPGSRLFCCMELNLQLARESIQGFSYDRYRVVSWVGGLTYTYLAEDTNRFSELCV